MKRGQYSSLLGLLGLIAVSVVLATSIPAKAAPVLLAEWNTGLGSGVSVAPPFVSIGLFYDGPIPSADQNVFPATCVGCDLKISYGGTTGTFAFNASNDPGFTALVGRLTNGINETVFQTVFYLDGTGNLVGHGPQGGNQESNITGTSSDLIGDQIDLITLNITSFTVHPTCCGGTSFQFFDSWQFWGEPVPEPSSLLLLASGLVGLATWRRKQAV